MRQVVVAIFLTLYACLNCVSPAWGFDLQDINDRWQGSAHALNGINCTQCHQDQESKTIVATPSYESCQSCHEQAVDTFLLGKHGIRLLENKSPLTPAMANIPMQPSAHDRIMNCNTCHDVHSVNTVTAAVDACLSCHNDTHSLNYNQSPHGKLFVEVKATLPRPDAQSITCATCHLPRHVVGNGSNAKTGVNHNNTFTLLPRDRMVKEVCLNCHGMEYSFNNIFDDEVVESNFAYGSEQDLQTLQMIRAASANRSN
ncbi:MAG: cytochrome c3 family protein [Prochlorotrichaceae cyanobacterium]|jgi:hypothetical protein